MYAQFIIQLMGVVSLAIAEHIEAGVIAAPFVAHLPEDTDEDTRAAILIAAGRAHQALVRKTGPRRELNALLELLDMEHTRELSTLIGFESDPICEWKWLPERSKVPANHHSHLRKFAAFFGLL